MSPFIYAYNKLNNRHDAIAAAIPGYWLLFRPLSKRYFLPNPQKPFYFQLSLHQNGSYPKTIHYRAKQAKIRGYPARAYHAFSIIEYVFFTFTAQN